MLRYAVLMHTALSAQSRSHRAMAEYYDVTDTSHDALFSVVSEIFTVEKCRNLEIRVRGHSRSLKVVPFDRLGMISY